MPPRIPGSLLLVSLQLWRAVTDFPQLLLSLDVLLKEAPKSKCFSPLLELGWSRNFSLLPVPQRSCQDLRNNCHLQKAAQAQHLWSLGPWEWQNETAAALDQNSMCFLCFHMCFQRFIHQQLLPTMATEPIETSIGLDQILQSVLELPLEPALGRGVFKNISVPQF